jgi:alpha-tubulin suppressor-like RCC1 family protein
MISTKTLEDKANTKIAAGSLSDFEYPQLTSINASFTSAANKVATFSALPAASTKKGIIYYVISENKYYFSDGANWRTNFTSILDQNAIDLTPNGWGLNGPQIGDNTGSARSSPVRAATTLTVWSRVAIGDGHSLGLHNGILYSWGAGSNGQLGHNALTSRLSPGTVAGGITTWTQISAGQTTSFGITSAGLLYAWGYNYEGKLGVGDTTDRSSPVTVIGGITTWSQVDGNAGSYGPWGFGAAVTTGGIAYAWGKNEYGQLGDNTTSIRSSPVTVVGGITNWSQVSAGQEFCLGLRSSGELYAWGFNAEGTLGDNTTTSRSSPVIVVGNISTWSKINGGFGDGAAYRGSSYAITNAGIAYAWGGGGHGQIGDNTATNRSSPVTVVGGITNWNQLSGGGRLCVGITDAGIAYAWGYNGSGRLADGTATNRSSPVTVIGGITSWTQISSSVTNIIGISNIGAKGFL